MSTTNVGHTLNPVIAVTGEGYRGLAVVYVREAPSGGDHPAGGAGTNDFAL